MNKILITFLLISFSFSQNMGMLKTIKNKTGLGFYIQANYMYKQDFDGANIINIPEDYSYNIYYRSKFNFEIFGNIAPGSVEAEDIELNYKRYNVGVSYHLHQKNGGQLFLLLKIL